MVAPVAGGSVGAGALPGLPRRVTKPPEDLARARRIPHPRVPPAARSGRRGPEPRAPPPSPPTLHPPRAPRPPRARHDARGGQAHGLPHASRRVPPPSPARAPLPRPGARAVRRSVRLGRLFPSARRRIRVLRRGHRAAGRPRGARAPKSSGRTMASCAEAGCGARWRLGRPSRAHEPESASNAACANARRRHDAAPERPPASEGRARAPRCAPGGRWSGPRGPRGSVGDARGGRRGRKEKSWEGRGVRGRKRRTEGGEREGRNGRGERESLFVAQHSSHLLIPPSHSLSRSFCQLMIQ